MRIAQVAPLAESVPPKLYGGTERVVAILSDEVAAALVAVPLYYATWLVRSEVRPQAALARLCVYGAVVAVVVPLQFMFSIDPDARVIEYGFGPHMPQSLWVTHVYWASILLVLTSLGAAQISLHQIIRMVRGR